FEELRAYAVGSQMAQGGLIGGLRCQLGQRDGSGQVGTLRVVVQQMTARVVAGQAAGGRRQGLGAALVDGLRQEGIRCCKRSNQQRDNTDYSSRCPQRKGKFTQVDFIGGGRGLGAGLGAGGCHRVFVEVR